MKILVTGANGQLGTDLCNELNKRKYDVIKTDLVGENIIKMDITDFDNVNEVVLKYHPDAIIHTAAYTAVDAAEEEENKEKVYQINVVGTKNLVEVAKKINCKFLYISTDYVFNGEGETPWKPDDKTYNPLGYYGVTKLEGEKLVSSLDKYFIVRIAWVFGKYGNNFVKTMLKLSSKYSELRVVNDQIGTPTYTKDLAILLADMIVTEKYGYYHASNEGGYLSWYEFAKEIFKQANIQINVIPVTTKEYGLSIAKRPLNSRLDKSKLSANGFKRLPDYKDALGRYLKEIDLK